MRVDEIDLTNLDLFVEGDPHGAFRVLRDCAPVFWHERARGRGFWAITPYADVRAVYLDPKSFSSARGMQLYFGEPASEHSGFEQMMIMIDPPRHAKMRQIVNRRFTPRAVEVYAARVRSIATEILDSAVEIGECDFVTEIAARLPTAVICEMMGIEREVWPTMFAIANAAVGRLDPEYSRGRSGRDTMMAVQAESARYFIDQARRRRANPTHDLISAFANATIDDVPLSDSEITANCFMLIGAGQETTRNAITGSILALLENPAELRKFVAAPSASTVIEELLRWTSPVTHVMRTVTRDFDFRGHRMRAGDRAVVWNVSANRDEAQFPEADRLNLERTPNEHLGFGYGEHFCLGANLARLEMRIMFEEIARRFASIEHAGPVERVRSNFVAGIKHMPVRLKPRTAAAI